MLLPEGGAGQAGETRHTHNGRAGRLASGSCSARASVPRALGLCCPQPALPEPPPSRTHLQLGPSRTSSSPTALSAGLAPRPPGPPHRAQPPADPTARRAALPGPHPTLQHSRAALREGALPSVLHRLDTWKRKTEGARCGGRPFPRARWGPGWAVWPRCPVRLSPVPAVLRPASWRDTLLTSGRPSPQRYRRQGRPARLGSGPWGPGAGCGACHSGAAGRWAPGTRPSPAGRRTGWARLPRPLAG